MHALIIILQILSVLGSLSATVPMKRGNGLKPRHSKALEGRSAVAFHFKRLTVHQTIPPTKATKVSALPKTVVKRTPSVKKSPPAKARLSYTTAKKSSVRKTLGASSKAYKKKVCRRADNAQTGVSCSTTVETLTGGTATPPAEPSCNEIETCVECIRNQECDYVVVAHQKPGCVDKGTWGHIKAKSSLHCEFFKGLLGVTADHISLISKTIQTHIFSGNPKAIDIFGSHMDTIFHVYLQKERVTYLTRVRTDNGVFTYTGLASLPKARRQHTPRPFYSTWDSEHMYKRYDVLKMSHIAVSHTRLGNIVIPNSFDGAPICVTIVTTPGSTSGTFYPWAKEISLGTPPGTAC